MYRLMSGASLIAMMSLSGISASAQDAAEPAEKRLQSVTVTATKRAESAQSIPVAVNAIGEQELEQLGVKNFNDYLLQLPGVTAGGSGPGQNTIYIRGVASTTPNLTTAGVAGLAPNVAFYLDEQPLAQPGRNLDVYAADLERVEVLSGPQGTLFGASSQAGTVRLITNKPDFSGVAASFNASTSFTDGGEMSNSVEAMLNIPLSDKLAVRGVVYTDNKGGYIDNVQGFRDGSESGRFRPQGTVRANGVPVSSFRAGSQAGADLSGVTFLTADNSALVEDDFNDSAYAGYRLSLAYDFNEDWSLLISRAEQQLDTEGVFFADPELDDYQIQRFTEDDLEDRFENTSWTLEGRLGMLEALYTGAFTERTSEQLIDYSDYLFPGDYNIYYFCDATVVSATPTGVCEAPAFQVESLNEVEVFTQELRFNTPEEYRFRATFGGFYSDTELKERNDFLYLLGKEDENLPGNFPLTNGAATPGQIGNETEGGYFSEPGPFPSNVGFRNDILRTDEQFGFFGEASFDLTDQFEITVGARYYDVEVDFEGSANSSFDILFPTTVNGQPVDSQCCGTNISRNFSGSFNELPDTASTDGTIYKLTGTWTPAADLLFYATYSEGFRPGVLNRPGGNPGPNGYVVPSAVETDEVANYEIGWKTELFDNSLRFNGAAFFVEIDGLQTTIFDTSITNLFFSENAANAEVQGVEGEFTWAPEAIEGLTVAGAFSLLDTEITEVLVPTGDVIAGGPLAFAPEYQGNIRARYEWDLSQTIDGSPLVAHIMPQLVFSDDSFSDIIEINKAELDGYVTLGGTFGVTADQWSAELFAENLTNEYAELSNNFVFDRERLTPMRPRTIGVRVGYDF